jgi:hypothetical protein
MTSEERSNLNELRNAERKQQRADASKALESKNVNLQEIARQGGSLGRRIEREVRRFEQTGRVSSWLAGETLKAEASQNAAQKSGFQPQSQPPQNTNVPLPPISLLPSNYYPAVPFDLKPDIRSTATAGAGVPTCIGLALYTKTVGTPPVNEVWIGAGTVGGQQPTGFTFSDGVRVATSGSGEVYVELTINNTTGELVSVEIDEAATTPSNTSEKFRYSLGYYEYVGDPAVPTVTNYSCGSVDYALCRNWFTSTQPFYNVTFYRA